MLARGLAHFARFAPSERQRSHKWNTTQGSRPRVHSIEKEIKHLLAIVDSNMASSSATGSATPPGSSRVLTAAYLEGHGNSVRARE